MADSDVTFIFPGTIVGSPGVSRCFVGQKIGGNRPTKVVRMSGSGDRLFTSMPAEPESPGPLAFYPGDEPEDESFSREKLFFETVPTAALGRYRGQHVAVYGQRIVDSDQDLYALTRRFFSKHGPVSVYIAFVGDKPKHFIPGPVIVRAR